MKTAYIQFIAAMAIETPSYAQAPKGQSLLERIFANEQAEENIPSEKILRARTSYDTDRGDLHDALEHERLYWSGKLVGERCTVTETRKGQQRIRFTDDNCDGSVDNVEFNIFDMPKELFRDGEQVSYENVLNLFVQ